MNLRIDVRKRGRVYVYVLLDGQRVLVSTVSKSMIRAAKRWVQGKDTGADRAILKRYGRLIDHAPANQAMLACDDGRGIWRSSARVDA